MKKLFLLILIVIQYTGYAQYFQTGQDPASIKWRQINTENFQLIYPNYFEKQAQQLAQKLEAVYDYGSYTLKFKPDKISVILHTQTVKSNGLVGYAPKRSEFYTTPHQAIYPQDWLEQLAVHEFRHVVQIGKLNHELPKIVKFLLGEQGTALVFGAYMPWWFTEGDAVVSETSLGNFGRGRFPSFLIEHKAQVLEKGIYPYDKAYNGSYKDYVPNHYALGYHLVANARKQYGTALWEKAIKRVGDKPFSLTPFNKALKLETGMNKVQLYHSIFDSLATVWKNEDAKYDPAQLTLISKKSKTYTNYTYNHWLNNNEIISYKTGLNTRPCFVKVNMNGDEQKIHYPGFIFNESINYRGEWIVWSEQIPDLRWSHSGRSAIFVYNANSGEQLRFTSEYKAFAPALSVNSDKVAVVETDFSNKYYISVYQISNGQALHRIQTKENNYFFSPEWINDSEIVTVYLTSEGKKVMHINLSTGEQSLLFDANLGDIKDLHYRNGQLFFTSGYSGKNTSYVYNFSDGKIKQLFEPRFDARYPRTNSQGDFIFSNYTGNGFQLSKLDAFDQVDMSEVTKEEYALAANLANQEIGKPNFTVDTLAVYPSKKYSKPSNLLNFHSWAPVFVDPYKYEFRPGISFMSQNKLGTAEVVLGYKWDTSEETGQFYGSYTYKGWYPVISVEASKGKRASNYWLITENVVNGEVQSRDTTLQPYTWKEAKVSTDIYFPLNLTRGKYFRLLQPKVNYEWTLLGNTSSTPNDFPDNSYHALSYQFYYHQLLRRSQQDVYSNFGFVFDASYKHSPFGDVGFGELSAFQSIVYVPGFVRNHGTKLYAGVQNKTAGQLFRFSDVVRFPRGWSKRESNDLFTLGVDYKLPLINPDFSVGGLLYCRRMNASIFADHSKLKANYYQDGEFAGTYSANMSSYGVELMGHLNLLRFYAPIEVGVRTSYLHQLEEFSFDFLISIDFNSL